MSVNLNSVKMDAGGRRGYHHGDLQTALIAAAGEVLEEKGVSGFSLREAARRAGVSPGAPAHHFGNSRGLLTALAAQGFAQLSQRLAEAESASPPEIRLERMGAAYIEFALRRPALFSIMWARELLDIDDPAYLAAGRAAFNVWERAATGEDVPVATAPHVPRATTVAAWAMVHGYARLALDGALQGLPPGMQGEVLQLLPRAEPGSWSG